MNSNPYPSSSTHGCLCWISSPGSHVLRQCNLRKFDDRRATIVSPILLPDIFDLFVTLDSRLGRRCSVVSRTGNEADVEFADDCEA